MAGRPVHELGFYDAVELPEASPFLDTARDHAGVERGHDLLLRWFPIDHLPDVALYPEFLRRSVRRLPDGPRHIVRVEVEPSIPGQTPTAPVKARLNKS